MLLARAAEACPVNGVVVTAPVIARFELAADPETIQYGEIARIKVQAKDSDGNDITPSAKTKVHLTLQTDEKYGSLLYKGSRGLAIQDVPYNDANTAMVAFSADGENPVGVEPRNVPIGATMGGKENVSGMTTVIVRCKIDPTDFSMKQNESSWADLDYDHFVNAAETQRHGRTVYYTVKQKGCALATLAMMLKQQGKQETPATLMQKMTSEYIDSQSGSILWQDFVAATYKDLTFKRVDGAFPPTVKDLAGNTLRTAARKDSVDLSKGVPLSLSRLDALLDKCIPVSVFVLNPDYNSNHFVVVVRKISDDYEIVDPGSGRTRLSEYKNSNGIIYGMRYVER
jgi:hypothetical protein